MSRTREGGGLHACLGGFPGAALALSADGVVVDSNGRLEQQLGLPVVGRPLAELLDPTSQRKWTQLLAARGDTAGEAVWELVVETPRSLELRTFAAIWGGAPPAETLWLIEYPRDARLVPLYEKLSAANSELVQVHRELARERARLARALAHEEEARAAAERATARLRALHAVTAAVLEPLTMAETARRLLERLREALESDSATILLLDEAAAELVVYASDGLEAEVEQRVRIPVGRGLAGRIATTRAPVVVDDVAASDVISEPLRAAARSAAAVPLLVEERLIGVLRVASATPRRFTPEDVQLLELVARDVASAIERARLLERERAARAAAEAAVRFRDEVLAIVAHDLRNPVARISGTASMLADPSVAAESRDALHGVLQRTAAGMNRLIGDLLDAASLAAGRLSVEPQPLDVRQLLADVRDAFQPRAAARGVALETAAAMEGTVVADHGRLVQALGNLLDNAIRLTPAGGRVAVFAEGDDDAVRLAVSDTGPGIPAEERPRLFDRFWQGGRSHRGSAGLGLAIVKGIAEAHGGRVDVESVPGRGSTFHLTLPRGGPRGGA